jgi:hypothetical protein
MPVIASSATPQGLGIEFNVSLGSIDALGALYDYSSNNLRFQDFRRS